MTRYVALLRGVNVGGHRRVPMADLRAGLEAVGCQHVRTHLQSGNVVFDSDLTARQAAALVAGVVQQRCHVEADVVLRTGAELTEAVARNPWPDRVSTPAKLHVLFLSGAPSTVHADRVGEAEQVQPDGREVWVWYGDGQGRSRLQIKVPGVVATDRNWSTVTALAGMVGD